MRTILKHIGLFSVAAGIALGVQGEAQACSPPLPGLTSSIPADGETYPANGYIFFMGYYIGLAKVSVTVNGQPATLSDISSTFAGAPFELSARVMPEPKPGDAIVISGDFCEQDVCAAKSISFTAGAADTQAPPSPSKAWFNMYDFPDFKSSGGDCQFNTDLSLWTHIEGMPAGMGEAPLLYHVEAFSDMGMTKSVLDTVSFVNEAAVAWGYRKLLADFGGVNPADVCFRITAIDGAGNKSAESAAFCKACYARTDAPGISQSVPPEPQWTSADIYAGGPCDTGMGAGGSGGGGNGNGGSGGALPEPEDEEGCSCGIPREGVGDAGWGALILALALGIRRKR